MSDETVAITVTDEQQAWIAMQVKRSPDYGSDPDWHPMAQLQRAVYNALPIEADA